MTQAYEENRDQIIYTWVFFVLATLIAFLIYKVKSARTRKIKFPRNHSFVDREKIVLALQIKDFIVKYSDRQEPNYLSLEIPSSRFWFKTIINRFLRYGHYYRPMFNVQQIREFLMGLKAIQNVELYIYSSLTPTVVDSILTRLRITTYFPENRRKYCDLQNDDDQKHAIQVDQDSRRVIIITPSYQDHFYEDQRYFLVLRPKIGDITYLREIFKKLRDFLTSNDDINCLHEQLALFKIELESEYSDYEL